jgi:hypothetical protein
MAGLLNIRARLLAMLPLLAPGASPAADAPERIVFIRHGEKPSGGLGQLDCQSLNRALALPAFFKRMFDKPDAIFAPNPSIEKDDDGQPYAYVRPLATTAILFGLPVNVDIGYAEVDRLRSALEAPRYRNALIFVAWEHNQIVVVEQALLRARGGNPDDVPPWKHKDFHRVVVITIADATASYSRSREGLDARPEACAS